MKLKDLRPQLAVGTSTAIINAVKLDEKDDCISVYITLGVDNRTSTFVLKDVPYKHRSGEKRMALFGTEFVQGILAQYPSLIGKGAGELEKSLLKQPLVVEVSYNNNGFLTAKPVEVVESDDMFGF